MSNPKSYPLRARTLEASTPLPIYIGEETLAEHFPLNVAYPHVASGMEADEESELQKTLSHNNFIPTPEVKQVEDLSAYNRMYPATFKIPKHLIRFQTPGLENDDPDYDMDSEDEKWLSDHFNSTDSLKLKFEKIMGKLERNIHLSSLQQQGSSYLLKEEPRSSLEIAVYDYWLNKRLRTGHPLMPTVKTESQQGDSVNKMYIAFRKRTLKRQTRKDRQSSKESFVKMKKLRRDLSQAVYLLELCQHREGLKKQLVECSLQIFEKRYQAKDYSGRLLSEVSVGSAGSTSRPVFAPLTNRSGSSWPSLVNKASLMPKKSQHVNSAVKNGVNDNSYFDFQRKPHCFYHAPLTSTSGNWPWTSKREGGSADPRFRFNLTSLATPAPRCVGLARRRLGRGGRVVIDRAGPPMDDFWASVDFTIHDSSENRLVENRILDVEDNGTEPYKDCLHFRPKPPEVEADGGVDLPVLNGLLTLEVTDLDSDSNEPLIVVLDPSQFSQSSSTDNTISIVL